MKLKIPGLLCAICVLVFIILFFFIIITLIIIVFLSLLARLMSDVFDLFEASVQLGSGFISVVGPPACGKTTAVLDYLLLRRRAFQLRYADAKTFHVQYVSARSGKGDTLSRIGQALRRQQQIRRRLARDVSPMLFGICVREWLEAQAAGSELHMVVDDCNCLEEPPEQVNLWASNCFTLAVDTRRFYIWLVSQMPMKLSSCSRVHLLSLPSADTVAAWLAAAATADNDNNIDFGVSGAGGGSSSPSVPDRVVRRAAERAVHYYRSHQPMSSSIVAQDYGKLCQAVSRMLPTLLKSCRDDGGGTTRYDAERLNALHFAAAWRAEMQSGSTAGSGSGSSRESRKGDSLTVSLSRIGLSAVLLAFAAFYCGAVPKAKQAEVFGSSASTASARRRPHEANAQSHKDAVLSSSTHVMTEPQVLFVYSRMQAMCADLIDAREFSAPSTPSYHIQSLVSRGILTIVGGAAEAPSRTRYRCWIPVSTALELGNLLSLSLYDLIPT